MKNLIIALIAATSLFSCKGQDKKQETSSDNQETAMTYESFGDKINDEGFIAEDEMAEKFKTLKPGDTLAVKFMGEVNAVCQAKGCWMTMNMGEEEAMVKFKEYGFFMPKDLAGKDVIVEGKAFVEEVSVDEQRHYAEDAGKTKEEIAAITAPKRTLSITSNGVLVPEQQ